MIYDDLPIADHLGDWAEQEVIDDKRLASSKSLK